MTNNKVDVYLDFTNINTKTKLHEYLKSKLNINYNDNLDSFYDIMYGIQDKIIIHIKKVEETHELFSYLTVFMETLNDLSLDNENIKYEIYE